MPPAKPTQDEIVSLLETTLEDGRLTRGEGQAFRKVIEGHRHDRDTLARFRNAAFAIAEGAAGRDATDPVAVVRWLGKVDKIIDNINRARDTGAAGRGIRAAFSPGNDGLGLILESIASARRSLDICVFTITDDRITNAVIDADRRGVSVRIVTDNEKRFDRGSDIHRLREAGLAVRFDPSEDHMHHKFAIIDGDTLLLGSYNWTRGATRNHESLIVLPAGGRVGDGGGDGGESGVTIGRFSAEFDRLWRAFSRS